MAKRNLTGAKPVTQAILEHLQAGQTITHQAAQSLYGTSRLAAYICTLRRKKGYNIKTHKIEVTSAIGKETEHKSKIAVYTLVAGTWDRVFQL